MQHWNKKPFNRAPHRCFRLYHQLETCLEKPVAKSNKLSPRYNTTFTRSRHITALPPNGGGKHQQGGWDNFTVSSLSPPNGYISRGRRGAGVQEAWCGGAWGAGGGREQLMVSVSVNEAWIQHHLMTGWWIAGRGNIRGNQNRIIQSELSEIWPTHTEVLIQAVKFGFADSMRNED